MRNWGWRRVLMSSVITSHFLTPSLSHLLTLSLSPLLTLSLPHLLTSCNYDETMDLCKLSVQLIYPEGSVDPYPGVRVELKDASSSVFVDSTDVQGMAHFTVPPGIYEASTATQLVDSTTATWWRYNFNGVRSMIIVSPDSANQVSIELKMSRKRIVH